VRTIRWVCRNYEPVTYGFATVQDITDDLDVARTTIYRYLERA
jgi:AcrR family transcriptional regulator